MYYKSLLSIHETPTGFQFVCVNTFEGVANSFEIHRTDVNPYQDAEDWANGKLIQDAFRYLYPNERELLITGMLPEDWQNMDDLGE